MSPYRDRVLKQQLQCLPHTPPEVAICPLVTNKLHSPVHVMSRACLPRICSHSDKQHQNWRYSQHISLTHDVIVFNLILKPYLGLFRGSLLVRD